MTNKVTTREKLAAQDELLAACEAAVDMQKDERAQSVARHQYQRIRKLFSADA